MKNKNILISGAGIAGPALAYWLNKFGFNPVIVEKAPALREGGYAIDFIGAGYEVAEKMGLLPDLKRADLKIKELVFVDKNNRRRGALDSYRMRRLLNYKYINLFRRDLSQSIYNHLNKDIEIVFGDSISKIEQNLNGTLVTFTSGKVRPFDIVVGADGLHSNVRNLVFGDELKFEKYFGYYVAAFTVKNYLSINNPINKDNSYFSFTSPGKQIDVYSINENELTALFIFSLQQKLNTERHDVIKQKQILRDEFKDVKWESINLLERLDEASDFYFDSVSQIRMERWSEGRVCLLGDAAFAPSLLAGQGSSLAIAAAYILAGELKEANGDYEKAFKQYERIFKPFIQYKQKVARSFAHSLVPKTKLAIWIRRTLSKLMSLPFLTKWFVKKYMIDKIKIKEYSSTGYDELISASKERNNLPILH